MKKKQFLLFASLLAFSAVCVIGCSNSLMASLLRDKNGPVQARAIGIQIETPPDETEYGLGDELDLTGLAVNMVFDDGNLIPVPTSSVSVSGFDNATIGEQTLTVSYRGMSATFSIELIRPNGSPKFPILIDMGQEFGSIASIDPSKHYRQIGDIDLNNLGITEWTPIGSGSPFTGSYDGGGFGINHLTVRLKNNSGLFGTIGTGGIVKNINLIDIDIDVGSSNDGGAVAITNNGTIENCYVTGKISGNSNFGGIAGTNNGIIRNCYVSAYIAGDGGNIGGIAGIANSSSNTIQYCLVTGNIIDSGDNSGNIGGIVGDAGGTINNCVVLSPDITLLATKGSMKRGRISGTSPRSGSTPNWAREDLTFKGGAWGALDASGYDGTNVAEAAYNDPSWWKNTALFTNEWWWDDVIRLPPTVQ